MTRDSHRAAGSSCSHLFLFIICCGDNVNIIINPFPHPFLISAGDDASGNQDSGRESTAAGDDYLTPIVLLGLLWSGCIDSI